MQGACPEAPGLEKAVMRCVCVAGWEWSGPLWLQARVGSWDWGRYGCSLGLALHSIQSFGPKSASLSVPSYLDCWSARLYDSAPCQPGSGPAFRFPGFLCGWAGSG